MTFDEMLKATFVSETMARGAIKEMLHVDPIRASTLTPIREGEFWAVVEDAPH